MGRVSDFHSKLHLLCCWKLLPFLCEAIFRFKCKFSSSCRYTARCLPFYLRAAKVFPSLKRNWNDFKNCFVQIVEVCNHQFVAAKVFSAFIWGLTSLQGLMIFARCRLCNQHSLNYKKFINSMLNFFDHNFVCSGWNSGCPTCWTSFKEVSFANRRPITLATPFVVHSKWNFVIRISSSFSLSETHQQQEKKNWWNWILCLHFLRCSLEFFFLFSFPCINKHTSDWMRFARSFSFLRLASFLIAKKKASRVENLERLLMFFRRYEISFEFAEMFIPFFRSRQ